MYLQSKDNPTVSIFCVLLVLIYVVMFATGPGSIPWFLVSELFNQAARPTATSLAVFINWTANFFVGLAFLPLKVSVFAVKSLQSVSILCVYAEIWQL